MRCFVELCQRNEAMQVGATSVRQRSSRFAGVHRIGQLASKIADIVLGVTRLILRLVLQSNGEILHAPVMQNSAQRREP
jgi:hypothetical protein